MSLFSQNRGYVSKLFHADEAIHVEDATQIGILGYRSTIESYALMLVGDSQSTEDRAVGLRVDSSNTDNASVKISQGVGISQKGDYLPSNLLLSSGAVGEFSFVARTDNVGLFGAINPVEKPILIMPNNTNNYRVDIIEIKPKVALADSAQRYSRGIDGPTLSATHTSLEYTSEFRVVRGEVTFAGTSAELYGQAVSLLQYAPFSVPQSTDGYIKIAEVIVPPNFAANSTVESDNIVDYTDSDMWLSQMNSVLPGVHEMESRMRVGEVFPHYGENECAIVIPNSFDISFGDTTTKFNGENVTSEMTQSRLLELPDSAVIIPNLDIHKNVNTPHEYAVPLVVRNATFDRDSLGHTGDEIEFTGNPPPASVYANSGDLTTMTALNFRQYFSKYVESALFDSSSNGSTPTSNSQYSDGVVLPYHRYNSLVPVIFTANDNGAGLRNTKQAFFKYLLTGDNTIISGLDADENVNFTNIAHLKGKKYRRLVQFLINTHYSMPHVAVTTQPGLIGNFTEVIRCHGLGNNLGGFFNGNQRILFFTGVQSLKQDSVAYEHLFTSLELGADDSVNPSVAKLNAPHAKAFLLDRGYSDYLEQGSPLKLPNTKKSTNFLCEGHDDFVTALSTPSFRRVVIANSVARRFLRSFRRVSVQMGNHNSNVTDAQGGVVEGYPFIGMASKTTRFGHERFKSTFPGFKIDKNDNSTHLANGDIVNNSGNSRQLLSNGGTGDEVTAKKTFTNKFFESAFIYPERVLSELRMGASLRPSYVTLNHFIRYR